MNNWFVYLIGLALGGIGIYLKNDTEGYIAGAVTVVLVSALPAIFKLTKAHLRISQIVPAVVGSLLALAVMGLIFPLLKLLPIYVWVPALGIITALTALSFYIYQNEVGFGFNNLSPVDKEAASGEMPVKILDTSIVIDGRIIDISSTGFIEGPIIVPNFVLREIQLISDSPDPIKRNRGRRGLDMLNQLQKREDLEIRISYKDYTDTREVDAKLVKLAKDLGGKLITNDFNLNKVAELQGIEVLNINNLANALKPVVLPGEEMDIQVVKEGKDQNQGIGYLDDGTMVVIENGGKLLGKKVKVTVTSVIQTNAGKMIFTKVVGSDDDDSNDNRNDNNQRNDNRRRSRR